MTGLLLDYLAIGPDPSDEAARVLRDGNGRAEAIAAATLDEVRAAMGMRY